MTRYRDAYIVVKGKIDLLAGALNENDKEQKDFAFKNNTLFRRSISTHINNTLMDKEEYLYIFMPMYNPLEYSGNYSLN